MIGKSQAFLKVTNLIQKMGISDVPVVIDGEAGTGKELAARAIHAGSARKAAPFVMMHCDSIPDTRFESEFLMHTNSVLAEANAENDEMIECAEGGTLFLDGVESLLPLAQATLLRFLQDQQLHLMGGDAEGAQNVRIIAACNGSLSALVAKGSFRQDLYYRLSPMHLKVPPLREREGDAVLLASHFLKRCAVRYGTERRLDQATLEWMGQYRWPGNVRELENLVSREYLMADKAVIHIQSPVVVSDERRKHMERRVENITALNFSQAKKLAISEFERSYLDKILTTTEGNVTRAAKLVGKERRSLGKLLKKHGIDRHQYVERADNGISAMKNVASRNADLPAWIPTAGLPEVQPSQLLQG